jgi:putative endonuclease
MPALKTRKQNGHKSYRAGLGAETRAAWFLRCKGYRILRQRLKTPFGEIDILAQKGATLVVVEVKQRGSDEAAAYAVSPSQQRRLIAAARSLAAGKGDKILRFDVMLFGGRWLPLHIRNAFSA